MSIQTEIESEVLTTTACEAAEQVFSMMLGLEVEPMPPVHHPDAEPFDGVVALLTFTGDWVGSGMFCCHQDMACRIGGAMMMTEVATVNADVLDGIGEMANMILGNIKESLESRTGPLTLSIPTVVYGKNFYARAGVKAPWTVVPFRCGEDVFEVRVCIKAL